MQFTRSRHIGAKTVIILLVAALVAGFLLLSAAPPGPAAAQTSPHHPADRAALVRPVQRRQRRELARHYKLAERRRPRSGEWYGVDTDASGRVTGLIFHGNNLTGTIPAELGSLSNLITLHLDDNEMTGTIPPELGNLSNLNPSWTLRTTI